MPAKTLLALLALLAVILLAVPVLVLANPGASEALKLSNSESDGVHVAPFRFGDALRYERVTEGRNGPAERTVVLHVEAPDAAQDAYGITRPTRAYRVDVVAANGNLEYSARCHALAGGDAVVRADVIAGTLPYGARGLFGSLIPGVAERLSVFEHALASDFRGRCFGHTSFGDRILRAGDVVSIRELAGLVALDDGFSLGEWPMPWIPTEAIESVSEPAERTTFHGRRALSFTFNFTNVGLEDESFRITVADGLPGIVLAQAEGSRFLRLELAGFEGGDGSSVRAGAAMLPETNPASAWRKPEPARLDDAAYGFAYPFEEAFAAVVSDPSLCVAGFLAQSSDAYLAYAYFDADGRDYVAPALPTRGSWDFGWISAAGSCSVYTVRLDLDDPARLTSPTRNYPEDPVEALDPYAGRMPAEWPAAIVTSAGVLALLEGDGVDVAELKALSYHVSISPDGLAMPRVTLETVPYYGPAADAVFEGEGADVDLVRGALVARYTTLGETRTHALFEGAAPDFSFRNPSGESFLGFLPHKAGLAAATAAVAGLAFLAVFAKLVIAPLYTRLLRDRLLDHPVRARLYERIRTEPGIHQAELVDYAGIGKGATVRHLDRLVQARFLVRLAVDGFTRYYAAGEVPPEVARREAILRASSARRVYDLFAAEPHLSLREAGRRLDMSAPGVHRVKRRLEDAGLLPAGGEAHVALVAKR